MLWHAKQKRLMLSGTPLDYITFGTGAKTLIMIQGLNTRGIDGAALSLAWMYRIFAGEYTVYLFDRRPNVPADFTVRDIAADAAKAMDALGLSNADVFGVSQGGMVAQYLAIDRPDLVNKLVLAVTLARNSDTVTQVIRHWTALAEKGQMKELITDMAYKMYSDAYLKRYKPLLPLLTLVQKPKDVQRFITFANTCLTCSVYDELDRIQCPVFVIGGKKDMVIGENACEEIAQKLKCRMYMYEHLGHAAYEEAPDFNRRVLEFLKS